MSVVAKFANDDEKFSESVRKEMKELLEARANNTWGTESCLPAMPAANEIVKPRSNAIVIEVISWTSLHNYSILTGKKIKINC